MTNEMTAEEAIKILNDIDFCNGNVCDSCRMGCRCSDIDKVKTMAIKALEQQPSEAILDKIKAEIENHCGLLKENHCRYCPYCNCVMGVREILEVIDKHREEDAK